MGAEITPTCPGHCCEHFPIMSRRARDEMIDFIAGRRSSWFADNGEECTHTVTDPLVSLEFINDMLIELPEIANDGTKRPLHRCRHFDTQTRLCTIYDRRPGFCRDYPNFGACDYTDRGCYFIIKKLNEMEELATGQAGFSDPPQPPTNQDEPVPYSPIPSLGLAPDMADAFVMKVRENFLKILSTEQAFQLLADLNRDLNEALAREIEEQTGKVSEAQQKLDRLSGLKYNLINR